MLSALLITVIYFAHHDHPGVLSKPSTWNKEPVRSVSTSQIKELDNLKVVNSASPPVDWRILEDPSMKLKVAYPNQLSATAMPIIHPGGELASNNIVLKDSAHPDERGCVISDSMTDYSAAISEFESTNTGDDGVISTTAMRVWTAIKNKDSFTFNGKEAARYEVTYRDAAKPNAITNIVYFVKNGESNFHYSCWISENLDIATADKLLLYSATEN